MRGALSTSNRVDDVEPDCHRSSSSVALEVE